MAPYKTLNVPDIAEHIKNTHANDKPLVATVPHILAVKIISKKTNKKNAQPYNY